METQQLKGTKHLLNHKFRPIELQLLSLALRAAGNQNASTRFDQKRDRGKEMETQQLKCTKTSFDRRQKMVATRFPTGSKT